MLSHPVADCHFQRTSTDIFLVQNIPTPQQVVELIFLSLENEQDFETALICNENDIIRLWK